MASAKTISIQKLFTGNYSFVVKPYQRGYRWEKSQIEHLLDDISSFPRNERYCLQPIIVKKISEQENTYELIDGQQRLTSLWMLKALDHSINRARNDESWQNFEITYENKIPLTSLICNDETARYNFRHFLSEDHGLKQIKGDNWQDNNLESNINYFFERFAKEPISNNQYCYNEHPDLDYFISNFINILGYSHGDTNLLNCLNDIFTKQDGVSRAEKTDVIWYELNEDNENPIEIFSNVNANKIPLTDAELVKAKFLSLFPNDSIKRQKIALEWESIEQGLCDENLWRFLYGKNGNYSKTRIDYLFRIRSGLNNESGKDYPVYDEIENELSNIDNDNLCCNAEKIWNKIKLLYQTICDWYDDNYYYHCIGLISFLSNNTSREIFRSIISNDILTWNNTDGLKRIIKDKIKSLLQENNLLYLEDISPEGVFEIINSWKYGQSDGNIFKILLTYNIAILVNAKNTYERFRFDLFDTDKYDLEHVNPKSAREATSEDKLSIGNLVLLDHPTNNDVDYKIKTFAEKRKIIINMLRYGLRTQINSENVRYVLPGTRCVFLDAFGSPVLEDSSLPNEQQAPEHSQQDRWNKYEKYKWDICNSICQLIAK